MANHNLSQFHLLRVVWISLCVAFGCLVLIIEGCVPASTVARIEGFNAQYRGFDRLQSEPFEPVIVDLNMKVVVLPEFDGGTYSHPQGIVMLKGKKVRGKIIVCPAILGHETGHALEYQGKGFVNPDELGEYGY